VNHIQYEALQRHLAAESDPAEARQIDAHLAICDECAAVRAALAAEDLHLSDALILSQADSDWVATVDLWPTVKQQITPWYLQPQGYLVILALLATCGWVLDQTMPILIQAVVRGGPMDLLIRLVRNLVLVLVQLLIYLDRGGILANIWPLPLLIGTVYLFRTRRSYSNA